MFQQFYEPHPALKGFVNNIMIHQVKFDATEAQLNFSIPPLPEHGLFFYVRDRVGFRKYIHEKKGNLPPSIVLAQCQSGILLLQGVII